MKKIITSVSLLLIVLVGTSAYIIKNSTGIASQTGAPGETSCGSCHGGATSATSTVNISATPSFTNNEYVPGTVYTISIDVSAAGFTKFGFDCEILDGLNTNTGTMSAPGTGVKFINGVVSGAIRKNAVHTAPKTASTGTANFTFQWTAPAEGTGDIAIYAAGNAVNGNGSTNGDFPITPVGITLNEGAVPTTTTTGITTTQQTVSQISVYPNPSSGISTMAYYLDRAQSIRIELIDLNGRFIKQLGNEQQTPGLHSQMLDLQAIPSGVYFVRTLANNQQVSQKLITVH